jgi:kynurenine formamidase
MLIDLSHTVRHGTVTYPGLPAPILCDFLSREASKALYAEGVAFHIGRIDMVANTGTYLDSPFHRYEEGDDVSKLALKSLANLPGLRVRREEIRNRTDLKGKAVLVETGWSKHWGTDAYFGPHPFLTEGDALYLRDTGAALVGIDSLNIDDRNDLRRPVHSILLGAGIPIVEHMTNLAALPDGPFRFYAVPPKIEGMGTFPVRAFALIA